MVEREKNIVHNFLNDRLEKFVFNEKYIQECQIHPTVTNDIIC